MLTGAVFLGQLGCQAGEPPPPLPDQQLGGMTVKGATLEHGRGLYGRYCASCHGTDGSGRGPVAASLDPKPRDFQTARFRQKSSPGDDLPSHDDLVLMIERGSPERGMPGWKGMRREDLDALAHYIKTFSPRWRQESSLSTKGDPS